MAIKRFAGDKFTGLSTDSKPTNVLIGATFYETDTQLAFIYTGSAWSELDYVNPTDLGAAAFTNDYNDLDNLPDLSALAQRVEQYANVASFPAEGLDTVLYIAKDTGYLYRWTGSAYVQLTDQTAVWGSISGTLSNQSDLNTALGTKVEDGQNVGTGAGVFKDKSGTNLRFRSIKAGTNITIDTSDPDEVKIESTASANPSGAAGDVQFTDGTNLDSDTAFNYNKTNKVLKVPDLKIIESTGNNNAGDNNEAVFKVKTEVVGTDTVVKVLANIGNGNDVIIASYIDPA